MSVNEVQSNATAAQAVVVGLCAHGLAIVRSLANAGVEVIAVESKTHLPGFRTKKARIFEVEDLTGPALTDGLIELATLENTKAKPVLFLTNDRMVRQIAEEWPRLSNRYRLSWGSSCDQVARFLDKRHIEERCAELDIPYPKTLILDKAIEDLSAVRYPAIVKPANPLGAFKAIVVKRDSELRALINRYSVSLPFLVQDWVEGPDSALYVCALMIHGGAVKMRFDGRKLRSYPPGTGQTSVMEYRRNDSVYELANSFFSGLGIEGPVSIEVKKAPDGKYFMIEPTVGRTDYFVDAMSANGANFPACEFALATESQCSTVVCAQDYAVWFDTERDRLSFVRTFRKLYELGRIRKPVFPYLSANDLRPFVAAMSMAFPAALRSLYHKIMKRLSATRPD